MYSFLCNIQQQWSRYNKDQIRPKLNKRNLTLFTKFCPFPWKPVSLHKNYKNGCSLLKSVYAHNTGINIQRSELLLVKKYGALLIIISWWIAERKKMAWDSSLLSCLNQWHRNCFKCSLDGKARYCLQVVVSVYRKLKKVCTNNVLSDCNLLFDNV